MCKNYPTNSPNATFKAPSIRGSLDVLKKVKILKKINSDDTTFITINSGNHYNYGNYRIQSGDNNSTVTREQQQEETVNNILEFLKNHNSTF